jgi:hypothetical protein
MHNGRFLFARVIITRELIEISNCMDGTAIACFQPRCFSSLRSVPVAELKGIVALTSFRKGDDL